MERKKLFVAGHLGMVGAALLRRFQSEVAWEILTAPRNELDLCRQEATETYLRNQQPDVVIVAAAKVGGIHANQTYPADFIHENLAIAGNLIHGAFQAGVPRLLFLGSSCIYPKLASQPIAESAQSSDSVDFR